MMSRVTPWICVEEWRQVYYWLYSRDVRMQKRGLDRVIAWRSRCKLPVAVECTAALIDSQLRDTTDGATQTSDARPSYALAIVRFINGITDAQQTSVFVKSVTGIASEIGLPQWLVDLRHDSTHKMLPSVEVLRKGCSEALEWLNVNYWQAYVEALQEDSEKEERRWREKVTSSLQDYIQSQLNVKQCDNTPRRIRAREAVLHRLVNKVNRRSDRDEILIELLASSFLLQRYDGSESSDVCDDVDDQSLQLPADMVDMWEPLLQHCHTNVVGFVSHLFAYLIRAQASPQINSRIKRLMSGWVVMLMKCASHSDAKADHEVDNLLIIHIVNLCLHYPGIYSGKILECVQQFVRKQETEQQFAECIEDAKTLVDICCGINSDNMMEMKAKRMGKKVEEESEHKEWTVKDIQNEIERNCDSGMSRTWIQCEDRFAWEMCPIGVAPHQTITSNMFSHITETDSDDTPPPTDTENETTHLDTNDASDCNATTMIDDDVKEECTQSTYNHPTEWTDVQLTELQQQIILL